MRRAGIIALSAGLLLWLLPPALAEEEPSKRVTVVKRVERKPDLRVKDRRRFIPAAQPSKAVVHRIIRIESRRWGAPAWRLRCRINGESGYRWWAANGQYHGLGQFAYSTFMRGMRSIGSRRVKKHGYFRIWRRSRITTYYSDGSRKTRRGPRYRVRVHRVYVGWIPAYWAVPWTHGWAQVRIMARSMVGRGGVNDSEWSVRC